jgi:putative flippase GtrA
MIDDAQRRQLAALRRLGRHQALRFIAVGVFLLGVDTGLFIALHALGTPAGPANLVARFLATLLGFWLHGRITFGFGRERRLGGRLLVRYLLVWIVMTSISTLVVAGWERVLGSTWLYLAKPAIELVLAVANYFALRHIVYRR